MTDALESPSSDLVTVAKYSQEGDSGRAVEQARHVASGLPWVPHLYTRLISLMHSVPHTLHWQRPVSHSSRTADPENSVELHNMDVIIDESATSARHKSSDTDRTTIASTQPIGDTGDSEEPSARGLSLPVFLTTVGVVITFSIAILSLNFAIPTLTTHVVFRILARICSAIGLTLAIIAALLVAFSASTSDSEESAFRVRRQCCMMLLLPSVLCDLVGLARVIALAWPGF